MMDWVWVYGMKCECGKDLLPQEFEPAVIDEGWPVQATEEFVRSRLVHPGCAGRITILEPTRPVSSPIL